ncbi:[protein-PII] uridylyltransferase [Gammaproteobacteria bacterium]|nr:[protein-PII] uridylyltransferase [Gammaproteobacteria bacterium]
MKENLDLQFWKWFPQGIKNPSKINYYLNQRSDWLDHKIINRFEELELHKNFGLFAIGGYGKKEIFPASDIDISIIQINSKHDNYEKLEIFIAFLWDFGHKVGHSVRTKNDIKKIITADVKEFTSYLTFRPLSANTKSIEILKDVLKNKEKIFTINKFFTKKKNEQNERYKSFDSTEFNLEPDLKESPGSLRDYQTASWILNHCFKISSDAEIKKSNFFNARELASINNAYDFIKLLRYSINLLQTSSRNRLNFNTQIELAKKSKIPPSKAKQSVEKLMQMYYFNAEKLSIFNETVFDKYEEKSFFSLTRSYGDFFIKNNRIGFNQLDLRNHKNLIFEIFVKIGQRKDLTHIDTSTARILKENIHLIDAEFKNNHKYSQQFLNILKSPYNLSSILRKMKRLGIIQAYISEFSEVIGQMQFDLFHVYTVDEHTFKVVRNMRQMKINQLGDGFEIENELINRLPKIEILYIAGLFHDLGKGKGGNHSEIGAKTSYNFAIKLGMSLYDANLISWLVLNHLEMSSISQRKDIHDPSTIDDFALTCGDIQRLNYLYLLTINDIRATNPTIWNGWKHDLLRSLFFNTRSKLNKEVNLSIEKVVEDKIKGVLKKLEINNANIIKRLWSNIDEGYFGRFSSSQLEWQAKSILEKDDDVNIISLRRNFDSLVEIFIKVNNFDGLFLELVRVFDVLGIEIIDADIATTKDKRIALNTFIASYKYKSIKLTQNDVKDLEKKICNIFNKAKQEVRPKKVKNKNTFFEKNTKVDDSIDKQKNRNIITIETINNSGLLVKIAKVFREFGASIHSAKITTLGEKVEDTFFIEDQNFKLISGSKMIKIKKALKEI